MWPTATRCCWRSWRTSRPGCRWRYRARPPRNASTPGCSRPTTTWPHTSVLHVLIRGELVARNAFPFSDACLADFLAAGLTERQASLAYSACWHLTTGELLNEHPLTPPRRPTQRDLAIASLDPTTLPALARVRATTEPGPADTYPTALKALLTALLPTPPAT